MGSLSFLVKQKKKGLKFSFNKKTIFAFLFAFCLLFVSYISCYFIVKFNMNYFNTLNLPKVKINIYFFYIVSAIIYLLTFFSVFSSLLFENNLKEFIVCFCFIFLLNIVVYIMLLIFHFLTLSLLLKTSNFILCCYLLKQFKPRTLGLYLFMPYLFFSLFNLFYLYIIYLLN